NTKFRDLLQRGRALGCDRIATGHYVRIEHDGQESRLLRGLDDAKDQSYFLWGLPPSMLATLLFPLGDLTKDEVRERARALELVTAEKPESQEICFVPTGDYRDLLQKRLGGVHPALEPGKLVTRDGRIMGEHSGYAGFTVGQRRGLGGGFPEPMFVLEIRPETREVVIGSRDELYQDRVRVGELNWLTGAPTPGDRVRVQLRYRAPVVEAVVVEGGNDAPRGAPGLTLDLAEPQAAVTPGQSAVVFEGDRVLGGGRIAEAGRTAATTPAEV
ncbi:MAG TPA: aminomethyltransferase beta-barrel domain-containing protein, partial [Longimicrobiales bacterium]|nr:aminomethyltransferase beta-barrel domain-containing protein [Longimicrobiales bacterium]